MIQQPRPAARFVPFLAVIALVAAGCGGGGVSSSPAPTFGTSNPTPVVTAAPTPGGPTPSTPIVTAAPTSGGPATSLTTAQIAVVRIAGEGSFVDPAAGTMASGMGTGFIIDPSGLVVTANHVVTGAALLKVWVAGATQPVRAKLLGASECSDLAVLQLEGGPYSWLQWYSGSIAPGLDIYAAGFPLSTSEYTLTRGIVSKAKANGNTSWSSVDSVIEHDAVINPGNSGGPLLGAGGTVVGINYASHKSTNQSWAIAEKEAEAILEQLRAGHDVLSIGINSRAVNDGKGTAGIWVAAVKSGSPADKAGLKPGDLITKMENLQLADNGTMADYCDILRGHAPTDTLSMVVRRAETKEVLEGQINGRPLEVSFSFANEYGEPGASASPGASSATYADFVTISDPTGTLKVDMSSSWKDTQTGDWKYENKVVGVRIVASPNIQHWVDGWDTAGAFVAASKTIAKTLTPSQYLARTGGDFKKACTDAGKHKYDDGRYVGMYHLWQKCGGLASTFVDLAVNPPDKSHLLVVQFTGLTKADFDALDRMLKTVTVKF